MKLRKCLLILGTALSVGLTACGANETVSDNTAASVSEDSAEALSGVSIDFENEKFSFATECSMLRGEDPSELSVEELYGSKALKIANVEGKEKVFVGFDMDALLGDRIADVQYIQFEVGVTDSTFNAVSGKLYTYTGEKNTESEIGTYAVYLDTDNPKTVKFELGEHFVKGAGNYIIISKEDNAATVPSDIMIDNIGFFDADGNIIEADASAEIGEGSPLYVAVSTAGQDGIFVYSMEGSYNGDWKSTANIPSEAFANAKGDVRVTLNFTLEEDHDFFLFAPISPAKWDDKFKDEDFIDLDVDVDAGGYHLQEDGFISIDDFELQSISFVLSNDAAKKLAEYGLTFQIHGVTASAATIEHLGEGDLQ